MKNRHFIHSLLILIIVMLTVGCSSQEEKVKSTSAVPDSTSQTMVSTESPLVTFIELGSVKCRPCKMMEPVLAAIENEYAGQVKVIFHDVWTDAGKPYADQYGIRAIPTQIFLDKTGNEYYRHTGFFPKEDVVAILKQQGVQ